MAADRFRNYSLRHHGAVHGQQHAVDRQGRLQVGDDLIPESFVDLLHRLAGRLGEGAQALDHLPALGLGTAAPHHERRAEHRHVLAVAAFAEEAGLLEKLMAGGDGGEGVGLGAEAGGEDLFHGPRSCGSRRIAATFAAILPHPDERQRVRGSNQPHCRPRGWLP
jgi:hypothetical protein